MKKKLYHLINYGVVFVIISVVSLGLVLPQILNNSLILGSDSLFHFNRIYDVYMQYKTGNFSYFQMNYGFMQGGRIVNALYGPGFAYILGGLLLIVHNWIKFQIISSFLIFFVSGCSMYSLSREMAATKRIAILISILFMNSLWVTRWPTEQNFMAWGTALMPLIIIVGIKMIKNNGVGLQIIPMALVVSLLIQVHLLSALIAIGVLVIFFIIGIIQTNQKVQLLLKSFLAGILALALTFNVWGGMLEIFTTNKIYPTYARVHMTDSTMNLSTGDQTLTKIGLIMSIIFILQIILVCTRRDGFTPVNKVVTSIGLLFLVLSSNLIPWTEVGRVIPPIQNFLQFPRRFEGVASVLLLAGFGATISTVSFKDSRKYFELLLIFGGISLGLQSYLEIKENSEIWNSQQPIVSKENVDIAKNISSKQITEAFSGPHLEAGLDMVTKATPDYLPNNRISSKDTYVDYRRDMRINESKVVKTVNQNGDLTVRWNATKEGERMTLPVTVYNNSTITLNKIELDPKKISLSTMGSPTVASTKMGSNELIMGYHSKTVTKTNLIIVVVAWFISGMVMIFTYKKNDE